MRRPARGATSHPPLARPGMGYGRPLRPDARRVPRADLEAEFAAFLSGDEVDADIVVLDDRSSVTGSDLHA